MILLAWGRNLMGFTEFAFKYLPGYNKFRTVSMTLVVVQWAVPLLGALALMRLWKEIPRERLLRALAWAAGITGERACCWPSPEDRSSTSDAPKARTI